jgi:hypothetical protein
MRTDAEQALVRPCAYSDCFFGDDSPVTSPLTVPCRAPGGCDHFVHVVCFTIAAKLPHDAGDQAFCHRHVHLRPVCPCDQCPSAPAPATLVAPAPMIAPAPAPASMIAPVGAPLTPAPAPASMIAPVVAPAPVVSPVPPCQQRRPQPL